VAYDPLWTTGLAISISIMCLTPQFHSHLSFETDYNMQISTNLLSFLWFVYKYNIFSS
jgi:hypothetical protein